MAKMWLFLIIKAVNKEIKNKKTLQGTTMLLIFWDLLVAEEILLSSQVKQSMIISNKWYIRVASQVAKRLKTWDLRKLGIISGKP